MIPASPAPLITVVIVNYNGAKWMDRCLNSIANQTIASQVEIIVTDNDSQDGSDKTSAHWLATTGRGTLVQNGANLGFSEGNNIGARLARGKFLLFLNNDAWLEPDCLEKLLAEVELCQADSAALMILDYDTDNFQGIGAGGLDFFGIPNAMKPVSATTEIFAAGGCSLFVRREMFEKIGGFPSELFMYAEETDLGWRIWLAGGKVIVVPNARVHHRGAASANPKGQTKIIESRTSETKRFLTNRNGILLLLKNSQHLLLLLLVPHLLLLALEALASLAFVRRWSYVKRCYVEAVTDCWRLRGHVRSWRARIRTFRRRSDFWMLRFLRLNPNRWPDILRLLKVGLPKVDPR